jgi:hypothetical protein
MAGYLHIFRTGEGKDRYNRIAPDYQVSYSIPGNSYLKSLTGDEALAEFLLHNAEVPRPEIDRALAELRASGRTTIPDVEIALSEAPALGMVREPSDE